MIFVKTIFIFIVLNVLLFSYTVEIKKEWHLLGALEDFNISDSITGDCHFYKYKNGEWDTYKSNETNGLTEIKKLEGFYAYSPNVCSLSYGKFICAEAGINKNYEIKATYCSYSGPDPGHFWERGKGFFDSPREIYYHNKFSEIYTHCGWDTRGVIERLGGKSACHEAQMYWGHI